MHNNAILFYVFYAALFFLLIKTCYNHETGTRMSSLVFKNIRRTNMFDDLLNAICNSGHISGVSTNIASALFVKITLSSIS